MGAERVSTDHTLIHRHGAHMSTPYFDELCVHRSAKSPYLVGYSALSPAIDTLLSLDLLPGADLGAISAKPARKGSKPLDRC